MENGAAQREHPTEPTRTCVGCGARSPRAALLRLALAPGGLVIVDPRHRAPGRGAHVHPRAACAKNAASGRGIGRAFRGKARPPEESAFVAEVRAAAGTRWEET